MSVIQPSPAKRRRLAFPQTNSVEALDVVFEKEGDGNVADYVESYGVLEGEGSEYVTLISGDGHSFIIKRSLAMQSPTLQSMMAAQGRFVEFTNEVTLRHIPGGILKKVIAYLTYREFYTRARFGIGKESVPDFHFDAKEAVHVLVAANFLQI